MRSRRVQPPRQMLRRSGGSGDRVRPRRARAVASPAASTRPAAAPARLGPATGPPATSPARRSIPGWSSTPTAPSPSTPARSSSGTGVKTALAQIVAEELDVAVRARHDGHGRHRADARPGRRRPAARRSRPPGRPCSRSAAEARRVLLTRAAARLGVAVDRPSEIVATASSALTGDPTTAVSYGELAGEPLRQAGSPATRRSSRRRPTRVVGQSVPRVDLLAKLTGGEAFVHDLRLDGMLHGRVVRPHVRTPDGVGGDRRGDRRRRGARSAGARRGRAAAAASSASWPSARSRRSRAARALAGRLVGAGAAARPGPPLRPAAGRRPPRPSEIARSGDVDGALATAARTLEATYALPFQAHASHGAVLRRRRRARRTARRSTPAPRASSGCAAALAPLLGLAPEQVRVIHREGAGCYGHNGADDVSRRRRPALPGGRAAGPRPVEARRRVRLGAEGPGDGSPTLRGGLDAAGNVVAWDYEVWTPTHSSRPNGEPGRLLAGELIDPPSPPPALGRGGRRPQRAARLRLPAQPRHRPLDRRRRPCASRPCAASAGWRTRPPTRASWTSWRRLAGADPVEFRLRHLTDPRAIDVVRRAAGGRLGGSHARPGASAPPSAGRSSAPAGGSPSPATRRAYAYVAARRRGRGRARASGAVRVARVVVAHDCGLIVNPDGVANQIEGNVIQGISRALKEEVTLDETRRDQPGLGRPTPS